IRTGPSTTSGPLGLGVILVSSFIPNYSGPDGRTKPVIAAGWTALRKLRKLHAAWAESLGAEEGTARPTSLTAPPGLRPFWNACAMERVSSTRTHENRRVAPPPASPAAPRLGVRFRARTPDQPNGTVGHSVPGPRGEATGYLGTRGSCRVCAGGTTRPAGPPLYRSRRLPLVRRHGPRGVRRPAARRHDRLAVRSGARRPRRASRRGAAVRNGGAALGRAARVPHHRFPDARRRRVLRRHVLPARRPRHRAGSEAAAARGGEELSRAAGIGAAARGADPPTLTWASRGGRRAQDDANSVRDRCRPGRRRGGHPGR